MKILKTTLIAILCIGYSALVQAQKIVKEGTVTYGVEYDLPANQQSMAAMLPSEFKVAFKGDMSRFKMDMGMYSTIVIYDNASKETLSLTEVPMQGKKIAVKMNKEQGEKMKELQMGGDDDFEVTPTAETKKIAGYTCTKYILKAKESGEKSEVWTTTELQIPTNTLTSNIKGVAGVPLEFSNNAKGMKSKMTFKSISEDAVTDLKMDIPSGFEIMSFDDVLKQMGG